MDIGERIKKLRKEKGITQEHLASETGISRVTLGFYERNENQPPIDVACALAEYFNISTDYLLGRTESMSVDIDNIAINKKYGLSDAAIQNLASCKELQFSDTASELIGHPLFIQLIQFIRGLKKTRSNRPTLAEELNVRIDAMLDRNSRELKNPMSKYIASFDDLVAVQKFKCQDRFNAILESMTEEEDTGEIDEP